MIERITYSDPDTELFWHDMPPRQACIADTWAAVLSELYQKPFVPVRRFHKQVEDRLRGDNFVIAGPLEEEVIAVKEKLVAEQGRLLTVGFSYLETEQAVEGEESIGPDPEVSRYFDNKFNQYQLFERLGLPVPPFSIIDGSEAAEQALPYYFTAEYSSGGSAAGEVTTGSESNDMAQTYAGQKVMVARHLGNRASAPTVAGISDAYGTAHALMTTDQILVGNRYVGNVLPSRASATQEAEMLDMTRCVGRAISNEGYAGVFCCDFFVDENNKTWITDLNPRRFG